MRILVTGGAGFIGSHVVEELCKRGDEVVVLDLLLHGNKIPREILPSVRVVQGDVCDRDLVFALSEGCAHVYHLAALLGVEVVSKNEKKAMDIEMAGIRNVCDAAIAAGVQKILYTSTSAVYGDMNEMEDVSEDMPVNPKSSYAVSKRHNEFYLNTVFKEHGIPSASMRIFNVYGPRQDARMVIPRFFEKAMGNEPLVVYDDGAQTRDFTYVKDVVRSMLLLADAVTRDEIFNIAYGKEMSIKELAQAITAITGSSSPVEFQALPAGRQGYEVMRRIGSAGKLETFTGYRPKTTVQEGLKAFYESRLHR